MSSQALAYDLLVFDWDGTLVDSEMTIVHSMQQAILRGGVRVPSDDEVRDIIGLELGKAIAELTPGISDEIRVEIRSHYRDEFFAAGAPALFPHARELLQAARLAGYRLAVATGKSRDGLNRGFKETQLDPWFEASRCADESASKPAPDMLLELMEQLRVTPERVLMIGDTSWDLWMARNAGCDRVGVSYGVHDQERLVQYEPKAIVHSLGELSEWLGLKLAPNAA